MRTWRKASKLAAVVTVAGGLALTGTSAAVADGNPAQKRIGQCGTGVFLDGIRALAVSENSRDEVYITSNGTKIWPAGAYVSMAVNQRVEVDKCVPSNAQIRLMEYDDWPDPNDTIGGFTVQGERTIDYEFCCGDNGRYRIGAIA
ncbi:hypothetical protein [Actinomadura kijaniata]|uniref:hypothetical protein n=1 Tax=Actinomadura kijaniata TaxID=46161 RepID=UPI000AE00E32|nr:hypothetical protein [Actinomadura kijaniata]